MFTISFQAILTLVKRREVGDEDWVLTCRTEHLLVTLCAICVSVAASCVEASRPLPEFVDIDLQDRTLPDGILLEHLKAFQTLYREHCEVGRQDTHTLIMILWIRSWLCSLSTYMGHSP